MGSISVSIVSKVSPQCPVMACMRKNWGVTDDRLQEANGNNQKCSRGM